MEIKIIISKSLTEFENLVNEFFYLIGWFNRDIFYFKKETIYRRHIATIIIKRMDFKSSVELAMKQFEQNHLLKIDPKVKERLEKALKLFYPKKRIGE